MAALVVLVLAGCQPVGEVPPPPGPPSAPVVRKPAPAGFTRYRVVPADSEIRALVYRDGPMARLGHNHVLRSLSLTGDIFMGGQAGETRFDLQLPVDSFSVDEAALRAEEGEEFPGVVDDEAIAGTRGNLLGEALFDAARFPVIRLVGRGVSGEAPGYTVTLDAEVKGVMHRLNVPVLVTEEQDGLLVTGQFTVTHGDLGLKPFSVMGGLLSVRDEIRLRFRILARRD
jgi:hypothetical protein